jgi:hypothetical protein
MNSNLNEIRLVKKQQLNPQLECSVYYHLFHIVGRELFPVWTYVTSGLFAHKQKEMIFVLKCLPEEKAEDFPCAPLSLFKIIFDYARQGVIVDEGEMTEFGPSGFLGLTDIRGVSYSRPEYSTLPDEIPRDRPYLAMIALFSKEFEVCKRMGITRILTLLGMQMRYYPFPPWCDRQRACVVPEDVPIIGPLIDSPHVLLCEGSAHLERTKNMIFMKVPKSMTAKIRFELEKYPEESTVVFCLGFDSFADCHLVWQPTKCDGIQAISAPGSKGERIGGAYIAFVPAQKADYGVIYEDGFILMLTTESWTLMRKCFVTGTKAVMLSDTEEGLNFELSFYEKVLNTMNLPPSSPNFTLDVEKESKNVAIKLLTPDSLLIQRVTVQDMATYTKQVMATVREYLGANKPLFQNLKEIFLVFEVLPDGKLDLRVAGNPITKLEPALEAQLIQLISQIPSLVVKNGPVEFQITFPIE